MASARKYIAEFIGTCVLVFMGCASAVVLGYDVGDGHLPVAAAFGLSVMAVTCVIGHVSGAHINPAVSLAMLLSRKMSAADFAGYVAAQIVGALAGAGLLRLFVSVGEITDYTYTLGSNGIENAGGVAGALMIEGILSFVFVLAFLGISSGGHGKNLAGILSGLAFSLVYLVGIPLTGGGVNPARSIGPALFAGGDALGDLWVFVAAPLLGAAVAAVVFILGKGGRGSIKA